MAAIDELLAFFSFRKHGPYAVLMFVNFFSASSVLMQNFSPLFTTAIDLHELVLLLFTKLIVVQFLDLGAITIQKAVIDALDHILVMGCSESKFDMIDPCSFANIDEFICTKIYWDVDVDFENHVLNGKVGLDFKVINSDATELILDTRDLKIKSVVDGETGEKLNFKCKAPGGDVNPAFGHPLVITLVKPSPAAETSESAALKLIISYSTSPNAFAAQWLKPEMTSGKEFPYMFTQCQPIYARTLMPCQDTPSVKAPYDAQVSVCRPLIAAMSAQRSGDPVDDSSNGDKRLFKFTQPVPIPSYLIVLVCGVLEHGSVGPRSTVWTEKEMLDASVHEFNRVEEQLSKAESLTFDYVWGIYDLLVLPPSFPYGGMENPCLTFVTPTLLAGDQSLTDVVAHEIAHSWTGNLVTNRTWQHFWLNEGFTVMFERMILGALHGKTALEQKQIRDFAFIGGWKSLKEAVDTFGHDHPFTCLIVNVKNSNPDDSFSTVPYEKGSCFLYYLASLVGGPTAFQPFLKDYLLNFEYQSVVTEQWRAYFEGYFKDKAENLKVVDWDAWLHKPGMPPINMLDMYDNTLQVPCIDLCTKWVEATEHDFPSFSPIDIANFSTSQLIEFLALTIQETPLPITHLARMNEVYNFNDTRNSEVKYRWCLQCCRSEYEKYYYSVRIFITIQGRMKFIRPIYQEMNRHDSSRQLAIETFEDYRDFYHPIAADLIAKDLGLA